MKRLKVSDDHRFLLHDDGSPFFYLGDTDWELFHRLTRDEMNEFLETRARQGFTVIQAVALAEFDGLRVPNPQGHLPLVELDPKRPSEFYFQDVDHAVDKANALGMYVGLLPTWGDKYNKDTWGVGPEVFTPENARVYGEYLGKRYKDKGIIWILGGDRQLKTPEHFAIIREMAAGLRAGDGGAHLITFHPAGSRHSSEYFQNDDWLQFNMIQSGHARDRDNWAMIAQDYALTPTKPVIDAEPGYEDHPSAFDQKNGYLNDYDARKFLYWSLFAGACGHTYGCHSIWQFWAANREPINRPLRFWKWAKELPGAYHMQYGKRLIEARPVLTRIPDQKLIVGDAGLAGAHVAATRCSKGTYAFVYSPLGNAFTVDLSLLSGLKLKAHWYDPRTGFSIPAGEIERKGHQEFHPPTSGMYQDWILILDDAAAGYKTP